MLKGNASKYTHFPMDMLQVVQGLIKVVAVSLATLNKQMSPAYISKHQLPPMLELEMHLSGGKAREKKDGGGVLQLFVLILCVMWDVQLLDGVFILF